MHDILRDTLLYLRAHQQAIFNEYFAENGNEWCDVEDREWFEDVGRLIHGLESKLNLKDKWTSWENFN